MGAGELTVDTKPNVLKLEMRPGIGDDIISNHSSLRTPVYQKESETHSDNEVDLFDQMELTEENKDNIFDSVLPTVPK